MKENKAMAFFNEDFSKAAKLARKFAGPNGRLATLPDIINARLETSTNSAAWSQYFSTFSAEYCGFSKMGNPLLIVAHGVGPMTTPEQAVSVYDSPLKPKLYGRSGSEGRITQQEFLDLESGKYGEIATVDLKDYLKRYQYPFIETLNYQQALTDPLVSARLGVRSREYVTRHFLEAVKWIGEENQARYKGEVEMFGKKFDRPVELSEGVKVLKMEDNSNSCYQFLTPDQPPLAHLLGIGQLYLQNGDHLVSDVYPKGWLSTARVVGIRESDFPTDIIPSTYIGNEVIAKHWQKVSREVTKPRKQPKLFRLTEVGGKWFTQYPKQAGSTMDTGAIEYQSQKPVAVSDPVEFKTRWGGYYGFFRYDIKEIQKLAPKEANSYNFEGEIVLDGDYHRVPVRFYKTEVDTTRYAPKSRELEEDFDFLMWLASQS